MLITGAQSAQSFEVSKWPTCNKTLLCPVQPIASLWNLAQNFTVLSVSDSSPTSACDNNKHKN